MKMIPLLVKEGSGVVARNADAATHHPLPLLPLRRGAIFMAARNLALIVEEGPRTRFLATLGMTIPFGMTLLLGVAEYPNSRGTLWRARALT
jgi:hypothetical protein